VYPAILEQLTMVEGLLFLGQLVSGAYSIVLLWQTPTPMPKSDRGRVVLLLGLCGLCFAGLVTSLTVR
jgi:hypothetical protein